MKNPKQPIKQIFNQVSLEESITLERFEARNKEFLTTVHTISILLLDQTCAPSPYPEELYYLTEQTRKKLMDLADAILAHKPAHLLK